MKITDQNMSINPAQTASVNGGSKVVESRALEAQNKDFQAYYQQQKKNIDQIRPSNNLRKRVHRQLERLARETPTFCPIENAQLLKDHKPQVAILLTAQIVQYHPARVWDTLTSTERLQLTGEHLEGLCEYLQLNIAELHQTSELKRIYLDEVQLQRYRLAASQDNAFTEEWILQKETLYPNLLIAPHEDTFNCFAESISDQTRWIWEEIGDPNRGYFEFFDIDQFYEQQGYSLRNGMMDMSLPNSIIVFGYKMNGIYQIKHAGRIDEHGFYRSKLAVGGTVLWPAPIADASVEYGQPLFQYTKEK